MTAGALLRMTAGISLLATTQVILSLSCEESDFLTDRSFASLRMTAGASLRMTAGASLRMTAGALLRMTAGALLRMTAGISLLAMKRW